jgi:hypothetical protein
MSVEICGLLCGDRVLFEEGWQLGDTAIEVLLPSSGEAFGTLLQFGCVGSRQVDAGDMEATMQRIEVAICVVSPKEVLFYVTIEA